MTICKRCHAYIGDIGDPHQCPIAYTVEPGFSAPRDLKGQKCDVCGSTAIDHTEAQCQLNRQFKQRKEVKRK